jgi:glycosyltransferase involved in cell wall biosynthesis
VSARVCIAVSVRNGEEFLAEAIESVLGQCHDELELRIYDNLSTDRSAEIARSYLTDGRVSYVPNPVDLGYYGSLNRALGDTDAPYFVPFAADDLMHPDNLSAKVALLESTGAGFVHSPVWLIDPAGQAIGDLGRQPRPRELYPAPEFFELCSPINSITCPAVVARSGGLRALGGFDGRIPYCADWLAWMRLSLRHAVAMVHEPLVSWRQHPQSGTSESLRSARYAAEDPAALWHALHDDAYPVEWHDRRDRMMAVCTARLATHLRRDGHRRASYGFSSYGLALRALLHLPRDVGLAGLVDQLARDAGVAPPQLPAELVAVPGDDLEQLVDTVGIARRLQAAGLLRNLAVAVQPAALAAATAILERELAAGADVDVDLVAADDPTVLLEPGRLAVVPFGSGQAAAAEQRGVAALATSVPDPLARAADPARYETLAA